MANTTAREFLYIVQESALGTPVGSPVVNTNSTYIRLTDGNAFSMYAKPVQVDIPYGGGLAISSQLVSDHYVCQGTLKTKLYPIQAALLLDWALQRINSGQTSPWTTTELAGDLASCTVYHAVRLNTGAYLTKTFGGVKVSSFRVEVSRDSTVADLTLGLVACSQTGFATLTGDPTTTPFPIPTEAQMGALLSPYTFNQTAGQMSINGSTRTQYRDLAINVANVLQGEHFESVSLSILNMFGRASQMETTLYWKATPDDRTVFEGNTPVAASVTFENGVTGQNLTVQFNAQNVITDLPWDLPLDKAYTQKMTLKNTFDQSAAGDIAFSFA